MGRFRGNVCNEFFNPAVVETKPICGKHLAIAVNGICGLGIACPFRLVWIAGLRFEIRLIFSVSAIGMMKNDMDRSR